MTKEELEKRKKELEQKKEELYMQLRSGSIAVEKGEEKIAELKEERRQLQQEDARMNAPDNTEGEAALDFEQVRTALIQGRAVTLDPKLGGQTVVSQIFEEMKAKTPLLGMVSVYRGESCNTIIPVLNPGLAEPEGAAEGADNTKIDAQANLGHKALTPHSFISTLPLSYHALKFDKTGFAQKLPSLFAGVFAQCFHKQIISGTGDSNRQFSGLAKMDFASEKTVTAKSAGKITVTDLAEVALTISDKTDRGCIVMHPAVYSKILADSPQQDLSAVYLKTLIEEKEIEGVKVILTSHMPKETSAASLVAIAGELDRYAMGIAGEIQIMPKYKVGTSITYFEAAMFANGTPILNDFYALKAK